MTTLRTSALVLIFGLAAVTPARGGSFFSVQPKADHLETLNGRMVLRTSKCEDAKEAVSALDHWSRRIGIHPASDARCTCSGNECVTDVTEIAPKFVTELHGTRPGFDGPNCWNASLFSGKLLPDLRYTTETEIGFYLSSPLCKKLDPDELPLPGDIIAIRSRAEKGEQEKHAFVYLTDQLSFSKDGASKLNPYAFQSAEQVFNIYGVPPECRRSASRSESKCGTFAEYFNCITMDDYLNRARKNISADYRQVEAELSSVECEVTRDTFLGRPPKHGYLLPEPLERSKSRIEALIAPIQYLAAFEADDMRLKPEERFLWQSVLLRVDSMQVQLDQIK